ncbi:alpha-hydroxy acid oxidase [Streptomyces sp. NPDC059785]|uniref:alpha-hydroxy acid oxidase n=1 Tax=unclassified Streptomyces TaxID=2593676 RepID=UPI003666AD9C
MRTEGPAAPGPARPQPHFRFRSQPTSRPHPPSLSDIQAQAEARLPADVRDYVAGGSGDELTLTANRAALDRIAVYPRVLSGTDAADPSGTFLGRAATMPVAVAPMAYQGLVHPGGEPALAAAARSAGVPYIVSTLSSHTVEEIADAGADTWFQLYWLRDRDAVLDLVRRAERAGCRALVVTVDLPVMARRPRDLRHGFAPPAPDAGVHAGTRTPSRQAQPRAHESPLAAHTRTFFDGTITWRDIAWLRDRTELPMVLKGILDPDDARRAVAVGADAVVVSNHGGRQLDGAPASIDALPAVAAAVADEAGGCEVWLDSGIRSGTDVLRALALGASGVLVGRPLLWGLAADGEAGARLVLDLLRREIGEALTLAGCADVPAARRLRTGTQASTPR